MTAILRILDAGPGVTLQDAGRFGYLRYGVTAAGPMDRLAYATANLAVGSSVDAPALEVSLGGLDLTVEEKPVSIAIAGGAFTVRLEGKPLPPAVCLCLKPGETLSVRPGASGSWCYIAAGGRLDVPKTLGSVSTHTRSHLGGLNGAALAAGDGLPISVSAAADKPPSRIHAPWLDRTAVIVRVLSGPQDDYFARDQIDTFLAGPWRVSAHSDRMGYHLEGPTLQHAKGFNIVSDGIPMGAVQVPGSGKPIVLMADRQPTGGYPKIATIIKADLGRFAQLRPGATLRFSMVSLEEAIQQLRVQRAILSTAPRLEPLVRTSFSPSFLLGQNLIDGFVSGDEE